MTTQTHLTAIANRAAKIVRDNGRKAINSLSIRKNIIVQLLEERGYVVADLGEKSHSGQAWRVKKSKGNKFRINYRCGYGRHNYAPVLEVSVN